MDFIEHLELPVDHQELFPVELIQERILVAVGHLDALPPELPAEFPVKHLDELSLQLLGDFSMELLQRLPTEPPKIPIDILNGFPVQHRHWKLSDTLRGISGASSKCSNRLMD